MEPRSTVGSVITLAGCEGFFCPAEERRCSCATSLQATANKWIFFFHLPISRILFYSPFTGELGENGGREGVNEDILS